VLLVAGAGVVGSTPIFPPSYWWYADVLLGAGAAATPTLEGPTVAMTTEVAERPFGGSLSTGISLVSTVDTAGRWNAMAPGIFAKVDLTYVILTGFWSVRQPCATFPVRIVAGFGVSMAITQSYFNEDSTGVDAYQAHTSYVLVRPQFSPTLDVEVPFGPNKHYAIVMRGTFDAPINFNTIFRFSASAGISVSWERIVDPG
jgi:hypothetical protein